jgi:hypothetical protein
MVHDYPSEAACKRAVRKLDDLIPAIYAYGQRKRLIKRPFEEYHRLDEEWGRFPEQWEDSVLGMLAADAVCGRPDRCAAFVRSIRDQFTNTDLAIAREWRRTPWFWCCFTVVEEVDRSLLLVEPLGAAPSHWPEEREWDELLIYSPTVSENANRGTSHFLCQLVYVESAFHTYGAILPFRSFDDVDLLAFADYVDASTEQDARRRRTLAGIPDPALCVSDIIADHPLSFLRLFSFAEVPTMTGRRGPWRRNASVAVLPEGEAVMEPGYWSDVIASTGHHVHSVSFIEDSAALYLDGGSPMYNPSVYLSFPERRIFLYAMHDDGYREGREALLPVVAMPEDPQGSCSMGALTAAHTILADIDELDRLLAIHAPVGEDEDTDPDNADETGPLPSQEEAEGIIERLLYNHNEGIEESNDEVAEAVGVDPVIVARLRDSFPSILAKGTAGDGEADRMGLSPKAFHELTSRPIPSAEGALVLRTAHEFTALEEEVRESIFSTPIMRFHRWLLDEMAGGESIPATKAGYVKPSVVFQAIEAGVVKSPIATAREMLGLSADAEEEQVERVAEILRPKREEQAHQFHRRRMLLETAKFLRLVGSQFEVTTAGRKSLVEPVSGYRNLIETTFARYNWQELSRFEVLPRLREQAGVLFYALHRLCGGNGPLVAGYGWTTVSELIDAFAATMPPLREALEQPEAGDFVGIRVLLEGQIDSCFVEFFGEGFGLIEYDTADRDRRASTPIEGSDGPGGEETIPSLTTSGSRRIRPTMLYRSVFRT